MYIRPFAGHDLPTVFVLFTANQCMVALFLLVSFTGPGIEVCD